MAQTLPVFESAVADAHVWVNEVADELMLDDRRAALHVLRAVLHALRDRLSIEVNAHLSAQLPLLIRGIYFENWRPDREPADRHHLDDFVDALTSELRGSGETVDDAREAVRAVFGVLGGHISLGEWSKIGGVLPRELRELWELSGA